MTNVNGIISTLFFFIYSIQISCSNINLLLQSVFPDRLKPMVFSEFDKPEYRERWKLKTNNELANKNMDYELLFLF